jgi:hypothetical protein
VAALAGVATANDRRRAAGIAQREIRLVEIER